MSQLKIGADDYTCVLGWLYRGSLCIDFTGVAGA